MLVMAGLIFFAEVPEPEEEYILEQVDTEKINLPEADIRFGVVVDSLQHYEGVIKRNQNAADILSGFDVDYAVIDKLAKKSAPSFNFRKIKQNNTFHIFYKEDSLKKHVHDFVYETDNRNYITYDITNPEDIDLFRAKSPWRSASGGAKEPSTLPLWLTLKENGDDPLLALDLSEIYAWTIDFFDIKKKD
ncbi:MAG: hypothetical protein U5L09_04550 [Bacteroidales bacterium]|nr:hypothetical protein [Bacteroidales bacterium]